MADLERLTELALDPDFRALSPGAKRLILERREPDFAELSLGARNSIVAQFESPAVRQLNRLATHEGAAQALGLDYQPPLLGRVAKRVGDYLTSDRPSVGRATTLIEADPQGLPVIRDFDPATYAWPGAASWEEDLIRGPTAVLERLADTIEFGANRLGAGGFGGYSGAAKLLGNAFRLMPDRELVSEAEFDEGVAPTLRKLGQSDEEIARRRAWATQPSRLGALADTAEAGLADFEQFAGNRAAAHLEASPAPDLATELAGATFQAAPAAATAIGEISPFVRMAARARLGLPNVTGMAAHGALAASDQGPAATAEGALHGAAIGGGLDLIHKAGVGNALSRLAGAGLFGGDALGAGGGAAEVMAAALTGAALVGPHPKPEARYIPELPSDAARLFAQEYPQAVELSRRIASGQRDVTTGDPRFREQTGALATGRNLGPQTRMRTRAGQELERREALEAGRPEVVEGQPGRSEESLRRAWHEASARADELETLLTRDLDPNERVATLAQYEAATAQEIAADRAFQAAVTERPSADPVAEYEAAIRKAWGTEGFETPPFVIPPGTSREVLGRIDELESRAAEVARAQGVSDEQLTAADTRVYADEGAGPIVPRENRPPQATEPPAPDVRERVGGFPRPTSEFGPRQTQKQALTERFVGEARALLAEGHPPTETMLSQKLGLDVGEARTLMAELEARGLVSEAPPRHTGEIRTTAERVLGSQTADTKARMGPEEEGLEREGELRRRERKAEAAPPAPSSEPAKAEQPPSAKPSKATAARAAKLREAAEKLTPKIEERRRPLSQNATPKRLRELRSRVQEGDRLEKQQAVLRRLADELEADPRPGVLDAVKTVPDVQLLMRGLYEDTPANEAKPTTDPFTKPPQVIGWNAELIASYPQTGHGRAQSLVEKFGKKRAAWLATETKGPAPAMSEAEALAYEELARYHSRGSLASGEGSGSRAKEALEDLAPFLRAHRLGLTDPAKWTAAREAVRELMGRGPDRTASRAKEARRQGLQGRTGGDFFPTPTTLAHRIVGMAGILERHRVLEPSAGAGDLAKVAREHAKQTDVIERAADLAEILRDEGFDPRVGDFLAMPAPEVGYDRIVMNPPFSKQKGIGWQDIAHVEHAYRFLKPGGALVAVMSSGTLRRSDNQSKAFRQWADSLEWVRTAPMSGEFIGSEALNQTGVSVIVAKIRKPRERTIEEDVADVVAGEQILPFTEAITGSGVKGRFYRGHGRDDPGSAYASPAAAEFGPILGPGRYWALDADTAKGFGPNVTEANVALSRVFVVDSNDSLRTLLGTREIPFENAERFGLLRAARERLEEEGYTGVVVRVPERGDDNPRGENAKRLREWFGDSQLIEFPVAKAEPPPPPPPRKKSPPAPKSKKPPASKGRSRFALEDVAEPEGKLVPARPPAATLGELGQGQLAKNYAKSKHPKPKIDEGDRENIEHALESIDADAVVPENTLASIVRDPILAEMLLDTKSLKGKNRSNLKDKIREDPDYKFRTPERKKVSSPKKETPLESVGRAASDDSTRFNLTRVVVEEGGRAIATDGHRLHIIENSGLAPGHYVKGESSKKWQKATAAESQVEYPNYQQVLPSSSADSSVLRMTSEQAGRLVDAIADTTSRYGLGGKQKWGILPVPGGAVNGSLFADILRSARSAAPGAELEFWFPAEGLSPIRVASTNAKGPQFMGVVMPMRTGHEGKAMWASREDARFLRDWDWSEYNWIKRVQSKPPPGDIDPMARRRDIVQTAAERALEEKAQTMLAELHDLLDGTNAAPLLDALALLEARAPGPAGRTQEMLPWGHTDFARAELRSGPRERAVEMLRELNRALPTGRPGRPSRAPDDLDAMVGVDPSITDYGTTPPGGGRGKINELLTGYERDLGNKPTPSTQPTRPGETPPDRAMILRQFEHDLGAKVIYGKNEVLKSVGALGYFKRATHLIRSAKHNSLEVVGHELAHFIDTTYPEVARWYRGNRDIARQEMREASYDVDNPREWFAEFTRYWLTQRRQLGDFAPEAVEWFEGEFLAKRPELKRAMERAQQSMHEWYDLSPLDQARSQIGTTPAPLRLAISERWGRLRQRTADGLDTIRKLEQHVYGTDLRIGEGILHYDWRLKDGTTGTAYDPADIPANASIRTRIRKGAGAWRLARMTSSSHQITATAMLFGAPKWKVRGGEIETTGRGMMAILGASREGKVVDLDGTPWGTGDHARRSRRFGSQFRLGADPMDAYFLYAIGRRAQLMRKQGRENRFTDQQIDDMVRLGDVNPQFEHILAEWQQWNKAFLDFAQEAGVIDAEARKEWETDVYLPFNSVTQRSSLLVGQGYPPGKLKLIHRLHGGTSNLRPVLDNMIANSTRLVDAALTNLARERALTLLEQAGGGRYGEARAEGTEQVKAFTWAVKNQIYKELGWPRTEFEKTLAASDPNVTVEQIKMWDELGEAFDRQGFLMELVRPSAPVSAENKIVAYLANGRPKYFEIHDDALYRSFLSLSRPGAGAFVRVLAIGANVKRATVTLSPGFWIANLQRDPVMAWAMSKHGFMPQDAIQGWYDTITQNKTYQEAMINGGGFSGLVRDEASFRRQSKSMARWYQSRGIDPKGVVLNMARDPVGGFMRMRDFMERLGDSAEMASRVGEWRRARKDGLLGLDAAYDMKEVATDFSQRPERLDALGRAINGIYDASWPMRAGILGLDRFSRGIRDGREREHIIKASMAVAAGGVMLEAMNSGDLAGLEANGMIPIDDRYDNLPDDDRDANWHFYIPTPAYILWQADQGPKPEPGNGSAYWHLRWARPWEIGAISRVAEIGMEPFIRSVAGTETDLNDQTAADVSKHMLALFGNQFRLDPIPDTLEPGFEWARNYDFYTGGPVQPMGAMRLDSWRRATSRTSHVSKALGEATRVVNPIIADHLVRGYFTWYGGLAIQLTDALLGDAPKGTWRDVPGIGRIYSGSQVRRTKSEEELGDLLRKADTTAATFRNFLDPRAPAPELAREYAGDPDKVLEIGVSLAGIGDEIQGFRTAAATVRATSDLATVQQTAENLDRTVTDLPGQPTFRVADLKNAGQWGNLKALKRAVINELDRRKAVTAYVRRAEVLEAEKAVKGK